MSRHSILEVNLTALKNNLELVRGFLYPHQQIIAIVKANAYGFGALKVTETLEQAGVDFFAVACISEAVDLRRAGIKSPLMVLSPFFENEIGEYLEFEVIPTLTDLERARKLSSAAVREKKNVPVHIKIDTGMGRIGIPFHKAVPVIEKISELPGIELQGLFSHFASADLLDDFSEEQIRRYKEVFSVLEQKGIKIPLKHIANSSGIVAYNDPFFNAVRPGIVLYGNAPSLQIKERISPFTVLRYKSNIIEIKNIPKGESVSYGRTFKADKDTEIGVIPLGYADGYCTLNSGLSKVMVHEKPVPVLGRVCMDYFMVDLTGINAEIGDEVVIYGEEEEISLDRIAAQNRLIPYELMTSISLQTERLYTEE